MSKVEQIVEGLSEFSLSELEQLNSYLQLALKIKRQNELSIDLPSGVTGEGPQPNEFVVKARQVLQDMTVSLSLGDMALISAMILADEYGQQSFSSREIHDEIKLLGRPPIANITTSVNALLDKGYLEGISKEASITPEGRSKAISTVRAKLNSAAA